MSFKFDWSRVSSSKELREQLREKINSTLQRGLAENENYSVILRKLDFGSESPELQIVKINELKVNKVHLVFAFAYRGDAFMSFDVNLQVNPLVSSKGHVGHLSRSHMGTLSAHLPLRASIDTTLSKFELDGTLDFVVDVNDTLEEEGGEKDFEPEYVTLTPEDSPSLLTKSKEVIKKIRSLSSSGREENNGHGEFSEVVKPKKPLKTEKGTKVTVTLLNEAFRDVRVNTSFDGSNASRKIGNTIKKHIRQGLKKIIGVPQSFSFSASSLTKGSSPTPSGSSVTASDTTAEGQS